MAKKYLDGLLVHETLSEHVDIHTWLEQILPEQLQYPKIWGFLKEKGCYFNNALTQYPENVSTPSNVQRGRCHMNNFLYSKILADKHGDILDDFRFITGLWLLRKTKYDPSLLFNKDENYFIGCHSFMTYKGNVLDCTLLNHFPVGFEVTQRFGVSFQIPSAVKVFNYLKETDRLATTPVIEAFCTIPYLKE